jgi:hypothetical protein
VLRPNLVDGTRLHPYTIDDFAQWQRRFGGIVKVCAGDDMRLTEDLDGCRMVGEEKSIDENQSR